MCLVISVHRPACTRRSLTVLNIDIVLKFLMSNGKLIQSFGAAKLSETSSSF